MIVAGLAKVILVIEVDFPYASKHQVFWVGSSDFQVFLRFEAICWRFLATQAEFRFPVLCVLIFLM